MVPILLHGCEAWVLNVAARRVKVVETSCMSNMWYILHRISRVDIENDVGVDIQNNLLSCGSVTNIDK